MKVEIKIPPMGESIIQATIGTILKPNGSFVKADDEIVEIETEKVNQVLYAPDKGKLTLNVNPQSTVKIGQVIGYVETDAVDKEAAKPAEPPKQAEKAIPEPPKPEKPKQKPTEEPPSQGESARLTTEDFLSDLKEVPTKHIAVADKTETRKPMSRIRKVIASRLVEVMQTTAMLTTFNEIDMSQVISLREKYQEAFQKKNGVKLGFMSFFVKASVSALKAVP